MPIHPLSHRHHSHHHHLHHHHGYYGHSSGNPICSAIFGVIFLIIFLSSMWASNGFSGLGYFTPIIVIFVIVFIGGVVATIVNAARRKSQMQTQPAGTISPPQGYPQQGAYPPQGYPPQGASLPQGYPPAGSAGTAAPQPGTYSPATFQGVPQPGPVGIPQPQAPVQAPASAPRFCKSCGMPTEGADQRFCANCGAEL